MKVTSTESLSADEPVQQTQVAPLRVVGFQVLAEAELSSCHLCPYKKSTEWPICFFSLPTKGHLQRDSAFKQNMAGFSFWWPREKWGAFCIGKILTPYVHLDFSKEGCQHVSLLNVRVSQVVCAENTPAGSTVRRGRTRRLCEWEWGALVFCSLQSWLWWLGQGTVQMNKHKF